MKLFNFDLAPTTLLVDVGIAALAAVGITILVGAEAQAVLGIPILTAVLTFALLAAAGRAGVGPGRRDGGGLTDPETGLATEEVGAYVLAREFAAAQRGRLLTIVLFRLDGLARYRTRHGDEVADQLVRAAGRTLARNRRGMDLVAPHGAAPGTFVAVLSATDREGAAVYAGRVRAALMAFKGLPAHEGVSVGIAASEMTMRSPDELVRAATRALDQGSGGGGQGRMTVVRGRVVG